MNDFTESDVQNALAQLKSFPPRDPRAAAHGRAQFLAQAESLQPTVSARSFWRQIGWTHLFSRKERFSMPVLVAVVLAFAVAVGGSGVAVYAAQDALPTDPLYTVKLFTEEVQLNFAGDPTARVDTLLELTQRRAQEIAALGAQGKPIPEQVTHRLEEQTEAVLQTAAGMDDATMARVLEQIRTRFEAQAQVIAQVQTRAPEPAVPALQQVQTLLAARVQVVQAALSDPHMLREQMRHRLPPRPRPTELPRPTITRTLTIPPRTPTPRPDVPPRTITPRPDVPPLTITPRPDVPPRTITPRPDVPPLTITPSPDVPPRTITPRPDVPPFTITPRPDVPPRTITPRPDVPPLTITPRPDVPPRTLTPRPDVPPFTITPRPDVPPWGITPRKP